MGGKNSHRYERDVGVGYILCCHEGIKKESTETPDHKKKIKRCFFFPLSLYFVEKKACPGKGRKREDKEIIVKVVISRMFGRCGADNIVKTEKFMDKLIAMYKVHAGIPREGSDKEYKDSLP